mmetsp:Transcript_8649/g.28514  ORF Transcript_8649/g.28514 Transcript_8649/m.28514 type:complete len:254 (+) Transcript_8649:305-1066(+)
MRPSSVETANAPPPPPPPAASQQSASTSPPKPPHRSTAPSALGSRASTTHALLSKLPVRSAAASCGCHAHACTLSEWCPIVRSRLPCATSHTLHVPSALALARTLRKCGDHASPSTASWWLPFFGLPFLDTPPSVSTGSPSSTTSRSKISTVGRIIPTAHKLRFVSPSPAAPPAQSSHVRHSGTSGRRRSWCTKRLPSSCPSAASSYTHTSSVETSSSCRAATSMRSLSFKPNSSSASESASPVRCGSSRLDR